MGDSPLVLVVGPSGQTGSVIVNALLESGNYRVAGLTRPSPNARPDVDALVTRGVTIHSIDWVLGSSPALVKAFTGVDIVISCCNWQTLLQQRHLIDAAKDAGTVKRFIPCDWGTVCPPGVMIMEDWKREVRAYLQASGLGYTFVHIGLWYQATFPPSPKLYTPSTAPPYFAFVYNVYGSGDVKSAVVDLNHIGMIVTKIIQDEATINQKVFACEDEITLNRAWALAQHYSGDERLREWKKTITEDELERAKVDAEAEGVGNPTVTILQLQYMQSIYVNGDNTIAAAKEDGWLIATELYPDLQTQSAENWAKEYYL